jgi:Mu transposase, C-terminal domain
LPVKRTGHQYYPKEQLWGVKEMPGQKINSTQVRLYMNLRKEGYIQSIAAAKSGFCERSARKIEKRGYCVAPVKRKESTRADPFAEIWEQELVPMLEKEPRLQAKTLLEVLQQKYSEKFPNKLLRTLQRRVKKWRALYGPDKEVIFRQNHPPGWQGLSDFTDASKLGITIQKQPFDHLIYHYRLAFSGWAYAEVILGGESFPALMEGLQNALWHCGGVPETHRTDSLSAAFKNLSKQEDLTEGYREFCAHYSMEPTRNNRGVSHENGTIEASHRHLKTRIDQALMIRGSRDFDSTFAYRQFVRELVTFHNRRIHKEYLEELAHLQALPIRKTTDYAEERVPVTNSSTILVKSVVYSVPSRLIGETLKVHLYDDRLECFIGGDQVIVLQRKRRKKSYERQINYRHLIEALVRKPGALKNYIYKEAFFPTLAFKQAWELLNKRHDSNRACKEYVMILKQASKGQNEEIVNAFLEKRLTEKKAITARDIQNLLSPELDKLPQRDLHCETLDSYAILGSGK